MVPVGTTAMDWWCPAISLCWRCRLTARSSIQWSGFGTICAATGSPTRYFVAWRTSWTPARWRGTGSPPTPAWSARSARPPGLRLRPLYSGARVVPAIEPWPEIKDTLLSRNFRRSVLAEQQGANVVSPSAVDSFLWNAKLEPSAYDQSTMAAISAGLHAPAVIWGQVDQFTP